MGTHELNLGVLRRQLGDAVLNRNRCWLRAVREVAGGHSHRPSQDHYKSIRHPLLQVVEGIECSTAETPSPSELAANHKANFVSLFTCRQGRTANVGLSGPDRPEAPIAWPSAALIAQGRASQTHQSVTIGGAARPDKWRQLARVWQRC